ncbi:MAG: alanine racemase [Pseudomonadota bacterium]
MSMRPRATIHLGNIVDNWRLFDHTARPGKVGAVLKCDAYGHGAAPVSKALYEAGCRTFFVAYPEEGADLRAALGPNADIFVFQGAVSGHATLVKTKSLTPVLNSLKEIRAWMDLGQGDPFALHVDTGMNRLGVSLGQLSNVRDALGDKRPKLIMSHMASADTPPARQNRAQLEAFKAAKAFFPGVPTSLENTAAHWLDDSFRSDLSRPGIGLYGGGTSPLRADTLKPGLTLEARILQISEVPADQNVGYGATATLSRDSVLATIGLGYGDGFPRSASNSGFVYLGQMHCPVVGRVSMDLITVDVTAVKGLAKVGGLVEVIGTNADLEAQAAAAGTLGYELLTGLSARVERIYQHD